MSLEARGDHELSLTPEPARAVGESGKARARRFYAALAALASSPLARRIVALNVSGLLVLSAAFLYLNQFREGLIDARVQALQTQSEIIAAAVAASASVDIDAITIDPEKLLQLRPGESYDPNSDVDYDTEFSINPERVGPVLRRLVSPTHTRARVYDRDGYLLVDSQSLSDQASIMSFDLPPPGKEETTPTLVERTWNLLRGRFGAGAPPSTTAPAEAGNGRGIPEVREALDGSPSSVVRVNTRGETIVSVAVPVQRFHLVRGVLLLSTQGGDIDKIIAFERWAIIRIFLVSAAVMFLLSLLLAATIAEPIRKLAQAAVRVRRGVKSREEIPDFTARSDEIGNLSGALRDMTTALYNRLDAIESFAADVAHELKNPLTSLRSAVETLPRARNDESRGRLLEIIQHDVRRLDRLISDISDASRLDAELARADSTRVDLAALLQAVVSMADQLDRDDGVRVRLDIARGDDSRKGFVVLGHDSRLAQVVNNLIDNARSFSPQGGVVRVSLRRRRPEPRSGSVIEGSEIIVDDDGPGIPPHALERIFERFYTDRPGQGFGQNSGLGLSISRQIVEAHGGAIHAINRGDQPNGQGGARFVVFLPDAA